MIGMMIAMVVLLIVVVICGLLGKKQKRTDKKQVQLDIKKRKNSKNYLNFMYRIYRVTPIVKRYFAKLKSRYRAIFPADEVTLNKLVTTRMTICLGICLSIMTVICVVCAGDLPYTIVGLLACYIIFTNMINSSEDKMQYKLMNQLDTFITDVHAYYHDTGMPDEAIASTLDDLPYEIGLHANRIYNIITSPDAELEMEKYMDVAPNKFLLLMAAICTSVTEYGDKILEDGKSLFLKNLNFLKAELNTARIQAQQKVNAFRGKTFAVLIPLFVLKPAELALSSSVPELKAFYQGSGGMISLAVISILTFVCYELINTIKDDHNGDDKEDKMFKYISEIPIIKKYLTLIINKRYTKSQRLGDALKETGDKSGINVFMVKRAVLAIGIFILANTVSFSAIGRAKDYIVKNYDEAYTSALVPDEEYRELMKDVSHRLHGEVKRRSTTPELLEEYVARYDLDPEMQNLVVEELVNRMNQYRSQYYKWWLLLISLGAGVVAFNIPMILLKYKQKIMSQNRENEVSQFRTLILILMHQDGMTIDTVLEWMERFAHAFKNSISDCIINLEYSQLKAIESMRNAESGFMPFRRLCDSLITVDKSGLEGAFDDLETEREYYQEKRIEDTKRQLAKNAKLAGVIQMLPVWGVIILYVILPFGTFAVNSLLDFGTIM